MGKVISKFNGKKELRLLILGLDSAGKTTILYHLKTDDTLETQPTMGFNVESIEYKNVVLNLWDVGGQDTLRSYWRHYYTGTQVLRDILNENLPFFWPQISIFDQFFNGKS